MGRDCRSVSDISQILINSKEKFSNSLILDKKIKIEKIGKIGNYCQFKHQRCVMFAKFSELNFLAIVINFLESLSTTRCVCSKSDVSPLQIRCKSHSVPIQYIGFGTV